MHILILIAIWFFAVLGLGCNDKLKSAAALAFIGLCVVFPWLLVVAVILAVVGVLQIKVGERSIGMNLYLVFVGSIGAASIGFGVFLFISTVLGS